MTAAADGGARRRRLTTLAWASTWASGLPVARPVCSEALPITGPRVGGVALPPDCCAIPDMDDWIRIRGARQHNLKNLDIDLPRRAFTVITGPSGSGKSSLALDTLFAEGQRRYVESLSTYAKQFLERVEKPDVDSVEGISPAVAIEQKNPTKSSRSTVGTATEVYDYLRLLWARVGRTYCPECGDEVRPDSVDERRRPRAHSARGHADPGDLPLEAFRPGEARARGREPQGDGVRADPCGRSAGRSGRGRCGEGRARRLRPHRRGGDARRRRSPDDFS